MPKRAMMSREAQAQAEVDWKKVVESFQGKKVLVLGDVMLDIFDFCYTSQSKPIHSEKKGKLAYNVAKSPKALGGAGNVAVNLRSLGAEVTLLGLTGRDGSYFTLREMAEDLGIEHVLVRDPSRDTTTKSRLYIDDEYVLRRDHETVVQADAESELLLYKECVARMKDADALVLSDYAKGVFTEDLVRKLGEAASEHGVPVVVDFKPCHEAMFRGGDCLVPNEVEAEALMAGFSGREGKALEEALRELRAQLQARAVAVTLGKRGIAGVDEEEVYFRVQGREVEEVDAVGCGDTVRAALALGRACGLPLQAAAELANAAAAVIVQKPSTASLSAQELLDIMA